MAHCLRLTIFLTVLAAFANAFAQTPVINSGIRINSFYNDYATALPKTLQAQGLKSIGILNLSQFQSDIETISWNEVENVFVQGSGGRRSSAVNFVEEKSVFLNKLSWNQTPEEVKPLIALHESFGALGYDDDEYNLSLGLWLAQKTDARDLAKLPVLDDFKKIGRKGHSQVYERGGTVTGVGGGGDQYEIQIKIMLLKRVADYEKILKEQGQPTDLAQKSRRLIIKGLRVYVENNLSKTSTPLVVRLRNGIVEVKISVLLFYDAPSDLADNILRHIGALNGKK